MKALNMYNIFISRMMHMYIPNLIRICYEKQNVVNTWRLFYVLDYFFVIQIRIHSRDGQRKSLNRLIIKHFYWRTRGGPKRSFHFYCYYSSKLATYMGWLKKHSVFQTCLKRLFLPILL